MTVNKELEFIQGDFNVYKFGNNDYTISVHDNGNWSRASLNNLWDQMLQIKYVINEILKCKINK